VARTADPGDADPDATLRYEVTADAPPDVVWALLARPGLWSAWAPHIRGAWGLGSPEVVADARGAVRVLGAFPVPARITAKEAGRSWTWRVGPVTVTHRVRPSGAGSVAVFELSAPRVLQQVLRATYGPIVALLAHNLARVAGQRTLEGRALY
jgi:hypothetical protein